MQTRRRGDSNTTGTAGAERASDERREHQRQVGASTGGTGTGCYEKGGGERPKGSFMATSIQLKTESETKNS